MNFQPLDAPRLAAAQQVARELFPWETEHEAALSAAVHPASSTAFLDSRQLASVRCWTVQTATLPVAGLATLYGYRAQPDEQWLAWFGLLPEARGCGAGGELLDWLIASVRAEKRRTLRLWTTKEAEYARAIALYLRRGFTVETEPALPGEDWETLVFSLGLDGHPAIPWSSVMNRGELCGREIPALAAVAA